MGDEGSDEERESRPHHFTFIAIFCTLGPASVSIIPMMFSCACWCHYHLRVAVQTVTILIRHQVAPGASTPCTCADTSNDGCDATRQEGGDKRCEDMRVRGTASVAVGGQGIADDTHELGVLVEPVCKRHVFIERSTISHSDKKWKTYPHMISAASTLIYSWPSLTSLHLATEESDQQSEKDLQPLSQLWRTIVFM